MGKYNFKERWDKESIKGRFTLSVGWAFYSLSIFGFVVSCGFIFLDEALSNEMIPLL